MPDRTKFWWMVPGEVDSAKFCEKAHGAADAAVFDEGDLKRTRRRLGDRCDYCGVDLHGGGHADHMTPIARGGSHDSGNITLACSKCNAEKHAKTADEYREWRRERGLPNWPSSQHGGQGTLGFDR